MQINWGFLSTLIVILLIIIAYLFFRRKEGGKELALIATMSALAALVRIPFAMLPSVQPMTFLIIMSGVVFGGRVGFFTGATAALVSNFFLGQGPWTPWQMLAWGLIGLSAGAVSRWEGMKRPLPMAVFGAVWGFLFGWITNLSHWLTFIYPLTLKTYLATYALSFKFDLAHSLTNFFLCLFLFSPCYRIMYSFRQRLYTEQLAEEETAIKKQEITKNRYS
ncbi:MAG TPA: ECF transporter S component [Syntrophomonadaceae bacterium]|nr:ECF transporter S component [Syntrophomonadaceae bacterium]